MPHQADIVDSQIGAVAARSLAKAEACGAAIGIAVHQIICAIYALITIAANHILFAEAAAINLVAYLQLSSRLVAAALVAPWKFIKSICTTVAGSTNDILTTLTGSIEHIALLIAMRYAHVVAVAFLAANHLMEAIRIRRASETNQLSFEFFLVIGLCVDGPTFHTGRQSHWADTCILLWMARTWQCWGNRRACNRESLRKPKIIGLESLGLTCAYPISRSP